MKFAMYSRFQTMVEEVGIQKTAAFAREQELEGVELYCDSIADVSAIPNVGVAREAKNVLDAYGLPMVCVSCAYDAILCPDPGKTMEKYLQITKALGSPYLHHTLLVTPCGNDTESEIMQKIDLAADSAVKIAKMAQDFGITCLYEDQGGYINGRVGFGRFFENVKSRVHNVGICADIGNILYADETPEDFFPVFAEDIKHVHIKDYLRKQVNTSPGKNWRPTKKGDYLRNTMVGHGVINYADVMAFFKEIGYSGYFALELDHPEPFEDGIDQAIHYLTPLFEGESQ